MTRKRPPPKTDRKVGVPKDQWHRLFNINRSDLTAICSQCGYTTIKKVSIDGYACVVAQRASRKEPHGLTLDEAAAYRNLVGCCEVCGRDDSKRLNVDHNHETGQLRGILCYRCNTALHTYENSELYEGLMNYLKYWNDKA